MEPLLKNGDFAVNEAGLPVVLHGTAARLQQAKNRLSIRKGSFAPNPTLGSRLHTLAPGSQAQMDGLALKYAKEALAPMPEIEVTQAACRYLPRSDALEIALTLRINGTCHLVTL